HQSEHGFARRARDAPGDRAGTRAAHHRLPGAAWPVPVGRRSAQRVGHRREAPRRPPAEGHRVMRAWVLPIAAGAFWTGILLEGLDQADSRPATSFLIIALGLVGIGATLVPGSRAHLGSAVWLVLILS